MSSDRPEDPSHPVLDTTIAPATDERTDGTSEVESLVGHRLSSFTLESKLGQGGMGIVYRATDERLRRTVALKVLPPGYAADPDRKRRFLREARSAAAVTHANVATIFEIGEAEGRLFIAMEFVTGGTLRDRMTGPPCPPAEVIALGLGIARGLARAHACGLVHRDLKPENIGLTLEGEVKLLDFGLAKRAAGPTPVQAGSASTIDGAIMGTPGYMAPEQALGHAVDARTDVFALGVVLYELATGQRPFGGRSTMDMLLAVLRDLPAAPTALGLALPDGLEQVILRCLARDPEARFADGEEVLAALNALSPGPDAVGPPTRPVPPGLLAPGPAPSAPPAATSSSPSVSKRRLRWAVGGAVVAALALLGIWARAPSPATNSLALACPPLEVEGVDPPSGWLGAAAANMACRLATPWFGGDTRRTRIAAELLGLQREPTDGMPTDPFGAPDARRRAVEAARAGSGRWLDGNVRVAQDTFTVKLVLRDASDAPHGEAEGRGPVLLDAVAGAMDRLAADGQLLREAALTDEVAAWGLATQPGALEALTRLGLSDDGELALEPACVAALAQREGLTPYGQAILAERCEAPAPMVAAAEPESPALAFQALAAQLGAKGAAARALADTARDWPSADLPESARASLAALEARWRLRVGDNEGARLAARRAALADPRSLDVWYLAFLPTMGRPGQDLAAGAYASWSPEAAHAWTVGGWNRPTGRSVAEALQDRVRSQRRAFVMAPWAPLNTQGLIITLMQLGRREEVRTLAARIGTRPGLRDLAAGALVLVDAAEGKLASSFGRLEALMLAQPSIGDSDDLSALLLFPALELAALLGHGDSFADTLVRRFVLVEPVRISDWAPTSPRRVTSLCLRASHEVRGLCLARLRGLVSAGYFRGVSWPGAEALLAGAELWQRGAMVGALEAWRPFLPTTEANPVLAVLADEAGHPELGARLDRDSLALPGRTIETIAAHAREARRARAGGQLAQAREHAGLVVEALELADVRVPLVEEMRTIRLLGP